MATVKKVKQIKGREIFSVEVGKRAYFHIEETDEIIETSTVQKVIEIDVFNYVVETKNTIYKWQRFGLLSEGIIERTKAILANRKKFS